jgi:hypothetical protein
MPNDSWAALIASRNSAQPRAQKRNHRQLESKSLQVVPVRDRPSTSTCIRTLRAFRSKLAAIFAETARWVELGVFKIVSVLKSGDLSFGKYEVELFVGFIHLGGEKYSKH